MKISIALLLAILVSLNEVNCLNILGIFQYHGKSHSFVFQPYLRELAKRGHTVTVISHFPLKQPLQNYTDISLAGTRQINENVVNINQDIWSNLQLTKEILDSCVENCKILMEDKNVQQLVKSRTKYDLVLVEAFVGDCALVVAYKLEAPVVALSTSYTLSTQYDRFGVPHQLLHSHPNPDFLTRALYMAIIEIVNWVHRWYQNAEHLILTEYFGNIPPLEELAQEIKMLLVYSHHSMFWPKAWPENIKEVGGYHVSKPQPLPEKLRAFIEQSEHGVIYVSFGSMVASTSMATNKLEAIVSALSELPQRVVWKFAEELPENPKNIYVSNWLPQNDILAHPNVVAFYSHGGLLGSTEAIHYGVPMILMPIFGDQPMNAMAIERKGFGVQMPYDELTKEALLEKFRTVLDPEFRRRTKEISREWHDRPISPMDAAIYWTEYAVRHPNSTLRTPAVGKPGYQLSGLDVSLTFFALLLISLYAFVSVVKYLVFGKRTKAKKD